MELNTITEQKILNAATEVFLEKGHDGARMQEIADKAGINKALLHYYFRSKNKLFLTVFKIEAQTMLASIFSFISPLDDFENFLRKFISGYLKNVSSRKNVMRFILWELDKSPEEVASWFFEVFEKSGFPGNPIILRVEKAIKDGEIKAVDPRNFILSLLGMCIFPFVAEPMLKHLLPGFSTETPGFIKDRTKSIIDLICSDIKLKKAKNKKRK
jgi:AcrR family transcriptional regulator